MVADIVCCDTSFLYSLYAEDKFTPVAQEMMAGKENPFVITAINIFELENTLRFAESRKFLRNTTAAECLTNFNFDRETGRLNESPCNLAEIFSQARFLSACHTIQVGHRSYDILHVASALFCKATEFFTFDKNQKKLAESEGLLVPI